VFYYAEDVLSAMNEFLVHLNREREWRGERGRGRKRERVENEGEYKK